MDIKEIETALNLASLLEIDYENKKRIDLPDFIQRKNKKISADLHWVDDDEFQELQDCTEFFE